MKWCFEGSALKIPNKDLLYVGSLRIKISHFFFRVILHLISGA